MFNHEDVLGQPINYGDMIVYSNSSYCALWVTMVTKMTPKKVNGSYPKEIMVVTDAYKAVKLAEYDKLLTQKAPIIEADKAKKYSKAPKKTYHLTIGFYYDKAKGRYDRTQPIQDLFLSVSVFHNNVQQGTVTRPRGGANNVITKSLVPERAKGSSGYTTGLTGKMVAHRYCYRSSAERMVSGKYVKALIGGLPEESTVIPFDSIDDLLGDGSAIGMTKLELLDAIW